MLMKLSEFMKEHLISLNDQKGPGSEGEWSLNTPLILSGDFNSEPDHSFLHLIYDKQFLVDKASGRTDPKSGHPAYKN